jgi:hypothetical protein
MMRQKEEPLAGTQGLRSQQSKHRLTQKRSAINKHSELPIVRDVKAFDNPLDSAIARLPESVREQIKACPAKGQGVHHWLFKTALLLHRYFSEDQIEDILSGYVSCDGREREIRQAVANSGRIFRGETPSSGLWKAWPDVDYTTVHKIVVECSVRLKDLQAISPSEVGTEEPHTEAILDAIFPGNPLLCFARGANSFLTRSRECWRGRESRFQFIVPNPMIKEIGVTQDGRDSTRCLDNTGPRRFLVAEFDISEEDEKWAPYVREWKTKGISVLDANVALLLELARRGLPRLPLALAVYSGGKSIHAWYFCEGFTEEQIRPFMVRAVRLGADPATWTRCQLVRMPDGTRDNGKRQQVHFFAPGAMHSEGGA